MKQKNSPMPSLRIGYLVNTYPRPSHSFIRREIAALERIGISVHRFAMRSDTEALRDPADMVEDSLTERILDQGGVRLLRGLAAKTAASPRQVRAALTTARQRAKHGESSLSRQLIYLAEGAAVARRAVELGLTHIHAHFGTNSARVAAYAQQLGGPGFSFTVHGPEEFDKPEALDLGGKLALSKFAVTVSSFGRSQMARWANAEDWEKIKVVHCGIEPESWGEISPMPQDKRLRMVAVGRFAEQKGFGLLIRAFAKAYRQNTDIHLSLVGDGPLRAEIEQIIRSESMSDAVELLGWQDEAGVRKAIANSHLLVTPSFAEGLPVVIMEAMASGRPCLATYIAGIPELVRPGHEGWLVPAGDIQALASEMLQIATIDSATLVQMGQAARTRALARHDVNRSAEMLAELFRQSAS